MVKLALCGVVLSWLPVTLKANVGCATPPLEDSRNVWESTKVQPADGKSIVIVQVASMRKFVGLEMPKVS
jgi:hypothetical protein